MDDTQLGEHNSELGKQRIRFILNLLLCCPFAEKEAAKMNRFMGVLPLITYQALLFHRHLFPIELAFIPLKYFERTKLQIDRQTPGCGRTVKAVEIADHHIGVLSI